MACGRRQIDMRRLSCLLVAKTPFWRLLLGPRVKEKTLRSTEMKTMPWISGDPAGDVPLASNVQCHFQRTDFLWGCCQRTTEFRRTPVVRGSHRDSSRTAKRRGNAADGRHVHIGRWASAEASGMVDGAREAEKQPRGSAHLQQHRRLQPKTHGDHSSPGHLSEYSGVDRQ